MASRKKDPGLSVYVSSGSSARSGTGLPTPTSLIGRLEVRDAQTVFRRSCCLRSVPLFGTVSARALTCCSETCKRVCADLVKGVGSMWPHAVCSVAAAHRSRSAASVTVRTLCSLCRR